MHGSVRLRDGRLCAPFCAGGQSSLHILYISALAIALELEETYACAYLRVGGVGPVFRVAINGPGFGDEWPGRGAG